jgi:hypothetical protein
VAKNTDNKSYAKQVALVAPAFMAKSVLGDLPKGAVEFAVEKKVGGSNKSFRSLLGAGLKGRGGGRALGAGLGVLTAPMFLKGVELASSKKKSDRKKGIALLAGSSASFAGTKGLTEGFVESRTSRKAKGLPKSFKADLASGARRGSLKTLIKTPSALLMGASIAASRRKSKGGKSKGKFIMPAVAGAAIGAGSKGMETALSRALYKTPISKKRLMSAMAGGGAAGALGGLALAGVTEAAMRALKPKAPKAKTASLAMLPFELGMAHTVTKGMLGQGRWSRALANKMRLGGLGKTLKSRQMGIGIREGIAGRRTPGFRGAAILNSLMPELRAEREAGQAIGRMLRAVPEGQRGAALRTLQKGVGRNKLLTQTSSGAATPFLSSLDDGVAMALGDKGFYNYRNRWHDMPTFKRWWEKATLGGRGVLGKGLPTAGKLDKPSKLKSTAEDVVGMALPGAVLATGLPLSTALGAHGLAGAGKKLMVSNLPIFHRMGAASFRKGLGHGLGARRERFTEGLGRRLLEHGISPGVSYSQTLGEAIGTAARSAGMSGIGKMVSNRATRPPAIKSNFKRDALLAGGAGAGIGALMNHRNKKKRQSMNIMPPPAVPQFN